MSYTEITELLTWLKNTEETTLLEILEVNSTELVEAFVDKIIENQDKFIRLYVEDKQNNVS